jgi:hypothetical protein
MTGNDNPEPTADDAMDGLLQRGVEFANIIRRGGGKILDNWFAENESEPAVRLEDGGEIFYYRQGTPDGNGNILGEPSGEFAVQVDDGETSASVLRVTFGVSV